MYQVFCDGYQLYDPRSDTLKLLSAKCSLEVNTVCGGSLSILHSHPYYDKLMPLRSVFEIKQDGHTIFRGRMTNDSRDLHKRLEVDLEGALAFANDTFIPPFTLQDKTLTWDGHSETYSGNNVVEFFLGWILDRHNENVKDWQKLKLGTVTVSDPNNTIVRSSEEYETTLEILKSRLFESTLGGYMYVRYEDDGNYVDYVAQFAYTNTQRVTLNTNILDINTTGDAASTYSVIMPIGAETLVEDGTDFEGDYVTIQNGAKQRLTLEGLEDGDLTDDLVKKGKYIYSRSAVDEYGWICVPIADSTRDDITLVENLRDWGMGYLSGTAMKYSNTIVIKAVDLSFTDDEIAAVRAYRNVIVDAPSHSLDSKVYPLPKLDVDVLNPQNTVITIGDTVRSLVGINRQEMTSNKEQISEVKHEVQKVTTDTVNVLKEQSVTQMTEVITQCNEIILSALEDYVETANFEQYKETVSTQLQILADEITMRFSKVTEHVTNVDGDLQGKFTQLYKYIGFSEDGITIGAGEHAMSLVLDNDVISFKRNGVQFGWWDGVDFHTGNIVVNVNERAQFGNFAFVPRSDGSLMFLKVGG